MLFDIATEELSHLKVIGSIVAMLNKGAKSQLAEAVEEGADLYRSLTAGGNHSHTTALLYGGGPALTNSAGVPWSAAYIDTIGEPTADLRSNSFHRASSPVMRNLPASISIFQRAMMCAAHGTKDANGSLTAIRSPRSMAVTARCR